MSRPSSFLVAALTGTLGPIATGIVATALSEILSLSRARPKTVLFQDGIRGVASRALFDWAGVAPLPTDPTPH